MSDAISPNTIFKQGSTTYYMSSLFFPPELRKKVTTVYAFVRTVDNFVDVIPQQKSEFYAYKNVFKKGRTGIKTGETVIDEFLELERSFDFDPSWTDAFWEAMELDLTKSTYKNHAEIITYMYGSAEVVGLMMAKLMSLPKQSFATAQLLGRSMQYINFLRDVVEDTELQRTYIPQSVLKKYKLLDVTKKTADTYPDAFSAMMRSQIAQYYEWQHQAEEGFAYLPTRARIAIETASDLYGWTAERIAENPMVVFDKKVKPSKIQAILYGLTNTLQTLFSKQ